MAVTKFQREIWSKKIQDELELKTKLVDNCTREYEGDCELAKSVRILGVGEPTIGAYDGSDITIEAMSDKDQVLNIDQANYFAFEVKDIDKKVSDHIIDKIKKKISNCLNNKKPLNLHWLYLLLENVSSEILEPNIHSFYNFFNSLINNLNLSGKI